MEETVRDRIKKLCDARGTNFRNLELTLGFGNGIISKYNKYSPKGSHLCKLANYFNVSESYILYGADYEVQYYKDEEKTPVQTNGRDSLINRINEILCTMSAEELSGLVKFLDSVHSDR